MKDERFVLVEEDLRIIKSSRKERLNMIDLSVENGVGKGWWSPPKGTHVGNDIYNDVYNKAGKDIVNFLENNKNISLKDKCEYINEKRKKLYDSSDEIKKANTWLRRIVSEGGDVMDKAESLNFDPSKEISLSRIINNNKQTELYRYQIGKFDKNKERTSRWSSNKEYHKTRGTNFLKTKINKKNLILIPEVLYSFGISDDKFKDWSAEKEYVLFNKFIELEKN